MGSKHSNDIHVTEPAHQDSRRPGRRRKKPSSISQEHDLIQTQWIANVHRDKAMGRIKCWNEAHACLMWSLVLSNHLEHKPISVFPLSVPQPLLSLIYCTSLKTLLLENKVFSIYRFPEWIISVWLVMVSIYFCPVSWALYFFAWGWWEGRGRVGHRRLMHLGSKHFFGWLWKIVWCSAFALTPSIALKVKGHTWLCSHGIFSWQYKGVLGIF